MSLGIGGADQVLQQQIADAMKAAEPAPAVGKPAGDPSPGDVERFQALRGVGPDATPPARPEAPGDAVSPPAGPESMGDRILRGMSSVGDKIEAGRARALEVVESGEATQADLLRANFALLESTTLVSAVSKTTEKITQGVKTLQQG